MKPAIAPKQFNAHMKWLSYRILYNLLFGSKQSKRYLNFNSNLAQGTNKGTPF